MTTKLFPPLEMLEGTPSLMQLQNYMQQLCSAHGWDKSDANEIFLLLSEEIGELAKAVRYRQNIYVEAGKESKYKLDEEFADVLSYLIHLANYFEIDLSAAFRDKETVNRNRKWGGTGNS